MIEKMSSTIIIRDFKLSDYSTLIQLWEEAKLPYKPKGRDALESIAEELKRGCASILIAEQNQVAIGTVFATHDGRKGWINRLAVAPAIRKKGVGRMLVEKAEKILNDKGIGIIACLIEEYNNSSFETFQKLGYVKFEGIHYLTKRSHPEI
jgi:N-acetylglutamate synthase